MCEFEVHTNGLRREAPREKSAAFYAARKNFEMSGIRALQASAEALGLPLE
jgi:hypothetical protein